MLTFLRKIRKSLIASGSTRKPDSPAGRYMLYAIGEIALVVIGILIALQINNWNEWRKERIKEEQVLEQLAKTIETNSEHFSDALNSMKRNNDRTQDVLSIIEDKQPYQDSMDLLFHSVRVIRRLTLSTSGYEELKNTGFDIIQSESLKQAIVNLFESTYSETEKIFEEIPLYETHFFNYIINNFLEIRYDMLEPINYEQIINDHYYYSSLLHIRSIRSWRIGLVEKSLEQNHKVLQHIKDKLQDSELH